MRTSFVPSSSGCDRVAQYMKLAVPPESTSRDEASKGVPARLWKTCEVISSRLSGAILKSWGNEANRILHWGLQSGRDKKYCGVELN